MPHDQPDPLPDFDPDAQVNRAAEPGGIDPAHPPQTPDELHAWIRAHLGITLVRTPLLAGSDAPFDYLEYSFFEGAFLGPRGSFPRAAVPRDLALWANRGGGKTLMGAIATLLDLVFKPGLEVRIVAGSLEQAGRMHEHLRRFFQRPALAALLDKKMTDKRIRLQTGSRVEILAQSQSAVRGTRVQKLRCDEVDLFDRDVWEAAQLTTLSIRLPGPWGDWVRGSVEALSTMQRPMGLMWEVVGGARRPVDLRELMARRGESGAPPDAPPAPRVLFRWGVVDVLEPCEPARPCAKCNLFDECQGRAKIDPATGAGHIPIDDAVAMKERVPLTVWESEMLCLRPRRDDAVLPEFDESLHVYDAPLLAEPDATLIAGMDFGFRAPTVILWARIDDDGVVRVEREHVVQGVTLARHIEQLGGTVRPPDSTPTTTTTNAATRGTGERPTPPRWIGVDPAGGNRHEQTGRSNILALRESGLVVRARRSGLQEGLVLIRARLRPASGSAPRLYIHRRCHHLIESMQRYRYPEDNPATIEPRKDGFDHAVDALRYMILNLDRPHRATLTTY